MEQETERVVHCGGCHCGRIRFEVDAPADLVLSDCNCTVCKMTGYLHLIVKASRFRLVSGEQDISTYQFNTGVAQHHFCSHCGIKSFYVPRSHPDGISVNSRCLDPGTIASTTVLPFDGTNWEDNVTSIAHLTD